jgi:hypothetical protein
LENDILDEMEREALRRAERMRSAFPSTPTMNKNQNPHKNSQPPPKHNVPKEEPHTEKTDSNGILDFLNKDKESYLLLMLIIFLYEDHADPKLLMALVYLLIA